MSMITNDHFLTYGKKTFGVPDHAYVVVGTPFPCADGNEMGTILASKAPEVWSKIKSKHIFILNSDGHDYMYVSFYVPGSPSASIDSRRLFSVHRPVCKGLVERFNMSNISESRKIEIKRVMNFTPAPDEFGPQVNPLAMRWTRYLIEAGSIPTERIAPKSKPRVLRAKTSGDGVKKTQSSGINKNKSIHVTKHNSSYDHCNKSKFEADQSTKGGPSFKDDGSSTSATTFEFQNDNSNSKCKSPINEWCVESMPFKRLRTLSVACAAKTNIYIMNNTVYVQEHE